MEPVEEFITDSRESAEIISSALVLMHKAFAVRDESDEMLKRHARHWQLGRLALVDRNILRLAVYEMRSKQTPAKVVITESLRLAQEFSTVESPRFVNGILDAVYKELKVSKE